MSGLLVASRNLQETSMICCICKRTLVRSNVQRRVRVQFGRVSKQQRTITRQVASPRYSS